MASKKTIEIVKSTAPVLEKHGETITKVFYKLLFKNHPELKDIFNMTHQKKGTQQKVLANAIFKYAVHIDKLEMLGDTVEAIAQKHTSLSIPKEAYPIVGENLLKAIKEVLGEAATPEIIEAWAEAYQDLSIIFIEREEVLYAEREEPLGGYRGTKEFIVVNKIKESDVITSFYLKRKDGTPVPNFISGQYIALTINIPGTDHKHTRNYSLSDINNKDYLRISIKKEEDNPEGIVSNYLHENIQVGDLLTLGIPSGEFIVKESKSPIVFISGGVGVTPLISMFKEVKKHTKRDCVFIQCVQNSKKQAFAKEINELSEGNSKTVIIYSDPLEEDVLGDNHDYQGFLTREILNELEISDNSEFYFCGPNLFMGNVLQILEEINIKEDQINYEFFGPVEELALACL